MSQEIQTGQYSEQILVPTRRNMHDNSLLTSVQCTSIRLLLNLVEVLFSRRADQRSAEPYRIMLASILDAFTAKLSSLHHRLPHLLAHSKSQH